MYDVLRRVAEQGNPTIYAKKTTHLMEGGKFFLASKVDEDGR
jgi:hypothetical protein